MIDETTRRALEKRRAGPDQTDDRQRRSRGRQHGSDYPLDHPRIEAADRRPYARDIGLWPRVELASSVVRRASSPASLPDARQRVNTRLPGVDQRAANRERGCRSAAQRSGSHRTTTAVR